MIVVGMAGGIHTYLLAFVACSLGYMVLTGGLQTKHVRQYRDRTLSHRLANEPSCVMVEAEEKEGTGGPYWATGIKPRSALYKICDIPTVLLLWLAS